MKVIFLDVDGVLNFDGSDARTPLGHLGIVDRLVKKLRTLVDNTNALVVIVSDWKELWNQSVTDVEDLSPDGQYLVKKLKRNGVHITSKTSDRFPNKLRGAAIMDWIAAHKSVESWCVLDDVYFDDYLNYMEISSHIVLTDPSVGLTDDNVKYAIDILNKQEE